MNENPTWELTPEDREVANEMNRISWEAIQVADPNWANLYLEQFNALPLDENIFIKVELLERSKLEPEIKALQQQGKCPDFFELKSQALNNLGISG